jgi:hypothetical protein
MTGVITTGFLEIDRRFNPLPVRLGKNEPAILAAPL